MAARDRTMFANIDGTIFGTIDCWVEHHCCYIARIFLALVNETSISRRFGRQDVARGPLLSTEFGR